MQQNRVNSTDETLRQRIASGSAVIGIIGLGYVGLPLALHFGGRGFSVIGFDLDKAKVADIQNGTSYIKHIDSSPIGDLRKKNRLEATTDFTRLQEADCILICVPTPLTDKLEPDLSYVLSTTKTIALYIRSGQLIVLESTTYPGTTDEVLLPLLAREDLAVGRDFFLAFSPEREDPGNPTYSAGNIPKVVGGITPSCLRVAEELYARITKAVPVSSTRVAEMTKILENTFRSVNIALVNELKVLAHKMEVDLFEVINAAATKPFGYKAFYPGPGLGGHCIPIDPFYLSWKAREYDFATRFIQLAGEINISMPYYVIERTADALNRQRKSLSGSSVLVLGMAYKKDIDDDRESPGYAVMKLLIDKGANVCYSDPWIPRLSPNRKYRFSMESVELNEEVLERMDAVVIVTDHSEFDYEAIVRNARLVVDTRNATRAVREGREKIVLA